METPQPPAPSVTRVVVASFIGTTIEWYDFFLYGTAAALVFDQVFFPEFDPFTGRMAAIATFSVGFFARPVGGIVFGHFGDRLGRKSMLVTTLMLMGLATFLIGLLPTYHHIGVAAPILLVLLRFIQGLGVGGEWGGAVLMAVEHGHRGRRGLYASWVQAGVPAGLLLATAVYNLFSFLLGENFQRWGWRVPFLLGIVLLGVGMFIRLKLLENGVPEGDVAAAMQQVKQLLRSGTSSGADSAGSALTEAIGRSYAQGLAGTLWVVAAITALLLIISLLLLIIGREQQLLDQARVDSASRP
jgi:MFS family permease